MHYKTNIIDNPKSKELDNIQFFISTNSESNVFQSIHLFSFFENNKNYLPYFFYTKNDNNVIVGTLLATIIKEKKGLIGYLSSRAIIWGGPIVDSNISDKEVVANSLMEQLYAFVKNKSIYIEFRNIFDISYLKKSFEKNNFKYVKYLNINLDVRDSTIDSVLSTMKYNRRREIKLSFKEGTTFSVAQNINEVKSVFLILQNLYINKVKLPLPDFSFFENIYKNTAGKIFVVKHNNAIIGGSFCLVSKEAIYTWYYCGITDYNKKIFPTHLAILATIDHAIQNNIPRVDFMGGGKPDVKYGVRNYKLQFGGTLSEYGRYIKINNKVLYKIGKIGLKFYAFIKRLFR